MNTRRKTDVFPPWQFGSGWQRICISHVHTFSYVFVPICLSHFPHPALPHPSTIPIPLPLRFEKQKYGKMMQNMTYMYLSGFPFRSYLFHITFAFRTFGQPHLSHFPSFVLSLVLHCLELYKCNMLTVPILHCVSCCNEALVLCCHTASAVSCNRKHVLRWRRTRAALLPQSKRISAPKAYALFYQRAHVLATLPMGLAATVHTCTMATENMRLVATGHMFERTCSL